jgi:hypothetical protein
VQKNITREEFKRMISEMNSDLNDLDTPFVDMTRIMEQLNMCVRIQKGRKITGIDITEKEKWIVKWKK